LVVVAPVPGEVLPSPVAVVFSASEPGSTFTCRLDDGAWSPCTSPLALVAAPGEHTFAVYARGPAGNEDPTPATVTWTAVDPGAP
jgi:hypothetical protein